MFEVIALVTFVEKRIEIEREGREEVQAEIPKP